MKKILALVLALAMIFALCACGAKEEKAAEEAAETAENSEAEDESVTPVSGVANPWVECTYDDIATYIGWSFGIPDGATEAVFLWNETTGMAEMKYTVEGTEWCARMQKTDAFEDISGMYYDFDSNPDNSGYPTEIPIEDYAGNEYTGKMYLLDTEEGTVNLAMWYYEKEGLMFSLGCVSADGILLFEDRTVIFFPDGLNTDADQAEDDAEAVSQQ